MLSFLAFARRTTVQLLDIRNLKYLHLIFKGFTPNKGYYYDFKKYGYKSYVTDTTRYLNTVFINYPNRDMLNDKYACYLFLKDFTDKVVPVFALINDGFLFTVNKYRDADELFEHEQRVVLKPRQGRGGDGVMVLNIENGKIYTSKGEAKDLTSLIRPLKNYVLVPYVQQHEYSSGIFPGSLNTIRLMTCILDDKAVLLRAGHRFGNANTGDVDNFSQGGVSTIIDMETGILQDPVMWDHKNRRRRSIEVHPFTGQQILGVQIPGWTEMRDSVLALHQSMKFIKYVGWDIAITSDGYKIIEANYASDVDGLQMHRPLLTDEPNRQFFGQYQYRPFRIKSPLQSFFNRPIKKAVPLGMAPDFLSFLNFVY